mgnify:CR=1 FL=1
MANPYWVRTEWLLGADSMVRLKQARVAVFGIGGVGSYAVEALARAGVGHLVLVDHDQIEASNLNRQIHAVRSTIGQPKVDVMRDRVLAINPEAVVITHQRFFTPDDPDMLLTDDLDYIIDAIDSVRSKTGLIIRARSMGIRIISCMGAGNKFDPTQFEVADISETSVCPLSRVIRRNLRKAGIDHLQVVYSKETPTRRNQNSCADESASPGSISFVPAVAGLIAAGVVIKDITACCQPE